MKLTTKNMKGLQLGRQAQRDPALLREKHYQYEPGDQVQDLTTAPPINGVVISKHEKPDVYCVRLEGGANDVVIHARNLRRN